MSINNKVMKIDIEKLSRKTPYPEPEDAFFKVMQDHVISKALVDEKHEVKKAKIFALDSKWMVAAAVVLIAGVMLFLTSENDNPELFANQTNVADTIYGHEKTNSVKDFEIALSEGESATIQLADSNLKESTDKILSVEKSEKKTLIYADDKLKINRKRNTSEVEVEKVLVAFTSDQLRDIERNSEQDVYLDLYY